uniref:Uncharacterized protein n=1 Tax=Vespula pensylvanica TaxID=30213 RepID=A0A834K4S0_VESPE|nr:hypothetical protein H0235_015800 [Vespula pensylvanica]
MVKWGYFPTCDDNKIGPLPDFNSYWFSFALYFDEETLKFSEINCLDTKQRIGYMPKRSPQTVAEEGNY